MSQPSPQPSPAADAAAPAGGGFAAAAPQGNLFQGRQGTYRLVRVLARGGQATVHEACGPGGEALAVKRLDPRALLSDKQALARFQRELDLLLAAGPAHPGLVALRDHGVDPLGVPFLVTELVAEACPLDVAFLGRDLPARVRLVREAAAALGALHARGIVHRDVSPENVLLDRQGRVRVTDLGLGSRPRAVQAALTGTGQALGTPGWVAPEVGLAGSRDAAPTVDVWGLGLLLYLALTDRHPFPHGFMEQLEQLRQGPPAPRAVNPFLPEALDEVCRRALAPRPEERLRDGAALAAALDEALRAPPHEAARPAEPAPPEGQRKSPIPGVAVPGASLPGPARIGRWTLLGLLGAGGMGRVLRARDEELGREVALKLLPGDATPSCRARFQREVLAASQVRHPALVRVHEAGEVAGQPYLVMELVEGTPLDRLLEQCPLAPTRAAALVAQLARGVAALHAAGVLHRDLKPGNVLLEPGGQARLIDFGVALLRDAERLSQTREVVGTPLYMAPEQLEGPQDDPRVDVYGLGAILFHALAGAPLGIQATSLQELLLAKARPVPPSSLRPTGPATPPLDPLLEAICLRALAPQRGDRFPDVAALAATLEAWSAGDPVALPRPAASSRAVALLGLVALLALGLATWALLTRPRERGPSPAQVAAWEAALAGQGRSGSLSGLELPPGLEAALPALARQETLQAARLRAWVGLARLARGDRAGAEALVAGDGVAGDGAEALATDGGDAAGAPGWLLRGGLAAASQPEAALSALERAERLGLAPPELFLWRARAALARGIDTRPRAEAALALAEGLDPDLPEAGELRVLGLAALGRREDALEAARRLGAGASPAVRWTAGILAAEEADTDAGLAAAARQLEGLERPPGPARPREQALAARALGRAAPLLADAVATLRRLSPDEREVVGLALRLHAALALAAPPPPQLREDLCSYLLSASLTGLSEAEPVALAAAAAWPDDPRVLFAAASCANRTRCTPEIAARLLPLARRAVERCPQPESLLARVFVGRMLLGQGELDAARANSRLALAGLSPPGTPLSGLTVAQSDELRMKLLVIEGLAARAQGSLEEALSCLDQAWALDVADRSEVRTERLRTLLQLGREADARAAAREFARMPVASGGWQRHLGELCWRLLREDPADHEPLRQLIEGMAGDGTHRDGATWLLRLAWLRWREGDHAAAAAALEAAQAAPAQGRRGAFRPKDLAPALAALRSSDPAAAGPALKQLEELLTRVERAATPDDQD